jgi:hypothetical protein
MIDGRPVVRFVSEPTAERLQRRGIVVSENTVVSLAEEISTGDPVESSPPTTLPPAPVPTEDAPVAVEPTPATPVVARRPNLVAVIDTGVDARHPVFQGRVAPGRSFVVSGNADVEPWHDIDGHGTAVAGVVLAGNPNATILPVKIMDDNKTSLATVLDAIVWAVDQGASVINLSVGALLPTIPQGLAIVLQYAADNDVVVVASAGNEAEQGSPWVVPAAADSVIAVAAVDRKGVVAEFSNRASYVDIAASGVNVKAPSLARGYRPFSGTSFSAPAVAGVASALKAQNPQWSVQDVRDHLLATATDAGRRGPDMAYGFGILNAAKALKTPLSRPVGAVAGPSVIKRPLITERVAGGMFIDVKGADAPIFARDSQGVVTMIHAEHPFLRVATTGIYQVWTYDRRGVPTTTVTRTFIGSRLPKIKATASARGGNTIVKLTSKLPKGLRIVATAVTSSSNASISYSTKSTFKAAGAAKTVSLCYQGSGEPFGCKKIKVR